MKFCNKTSSANNFGFKILKFVPPCSTNLIMFTSFKARNSGSLIINYSLYSLSSLKIFHEKSVHKTSSKNGIEIFKNMRQNSVGSQQCLFCANHFEHCTLFSLARLSNMNKSGTLIKYYSLFSLLVSTFMNFVKIVDI